jgi:hypothetical protein
LSSLVMMYERTCHQWWQCMGPTHCHCSSTFQSLPALVLW